MVAALLDDGSSCFSLSNNAEAIRLEVETPRRAMPCRFWGLFKEEP